MNALIQFCLSPLVNLFMLPVILFCIAAGEWLDRRENA